MNETPRDLIGVDDRRSAAIRRSSSNRIIHRLASFMFMCWSAAATVSIRRASALQQPRLLTRCAAARTATATASIAGGRAAFFGAPTPGTSASRHSTTASAGGIIFRGGAARSFDLRQRHRRRRADLATLCAAAADDDVDVVVAASDADAAETVAAADTPPPSSSSSLRTVTVLSRGTHHLVVAKPPSVVCHHSGWTGSRSKAKRGEEPEVPMLQRVRDAIGGRRVNLVHRLDRGASGCLIFTYAEEGGETDAKPSDGEGENDDGSEGGDDAVSDSGRSGSDATRSLIDSMSSPLATKTYVALVRGEGILSGDDLKTKGWFTVDRPIKDERGILNNATTHFRFVAGRSEDVDSDRPRASIVLARPDTGRWHQIRRHLNGLSHPILGDTSHGASKVNREWKERRNMPGERTCLHLARVDLPPTDYTAEGVNVACPLPDDMKAMLDVHLPGLLEEARPILEEEGVLVDAPSPDNDDDDDNNEYEILPYEHFDPLAAKRKAAAALNDSPLEILSEGPHHVIVAKPPGVVCHHSAWTGKRSEPRRRLAEPVPMLQRVRDGSGGRMVNLVHRLDRGASGCLVCAFLGEDDEKIKEEGGKAATGALVEAMRSDASVKTYVALVKGDGTWRGEDLAERGWFTVSHPVKGGEDGKGMKEAHTDVLFVAGAKLSDGEDGEDYDGASLVLARPRTGRWHQIRQHLAGSFVGHPILGDSSHGYARTNRLWKEKRGMMSERCCLHLARVTLPGTEYTEGKGLDVKCPIPGDMMDMLEGHMPEVLERARKVLAEEGVELPPVTCRD